MNRPILIILILFLLNACSSPEDKLFQAVRENNLNQVKQLLNTSLNINTKDSKSRTPLHYATQQVQVDITKLLFQQGANPNIQDNDKRTPLHLLFFQKASELKKSKSESVQKDLIKLFIKHKAHFN